MKLQEIDFGNVFCASGAQGFFGEGYWFHKLWGHIGLDFTDVTFVAKTATLLSHKGNMLLTKQYSPSNPLPNCIKTKAIRGVMLNSVGLSNPGLGALLATGKWQKRKKPFLISIMSLADTPVERLDEFHLLIEMIHTVMNVLSAPICLQINLSCPNTRHNPNELIDESAKVLEIAGSLGIPIMPKYSIASAPIKAICELNDNPNCDAICISNTLPFGWEGVNWQNSWGTKISPLERFGGGGLSGKILCPLVCEWIARLRDAGFTKPINGGGGIMCKNDVIKYHQAGASSIFIGTVAALRPWRVSGIVNQANK